MMWINRSSCDILINAVNMISQGRTRERVFEEELEVVWEKGGSGLVFYTDAAHWRSLEEAGMCKIVYLYLYVYVYVYRF